MVFSFEPPVKPIKSQRQENVPTHTFTPRTYQVELLDAALCRNTIACLATGAGKTFISALLLKELAHEVRPRLEDGGKRTVFLVNSVDMAEQQTKVLRLHTDLQVGAYMSDKATTCWDQAHWHQELATHQVLVLLPAIFLKLLMDGHMTLGQVNLLLFDECHLTTQDHPYAVIMQQYAGCPVQERPRIFGLTVSILSGTSATPQHLEEVLSALEEALCSTAETATDLVVSDLYGARPTEIFRECEDYADPTAMSEMLDELLESAIIFLEDAAIPPEEETGVDPLSVPRVVLTECRETLHALGPWCCGRVAQYLSGQVQRIEELEVMSIHQRLLQFCLTQLHLIYSITERAYEKDVQTLEDFFKYMTPKVLKIIEVLHNYKPDDNFMIIGDDSFPELDEGEESDDSLDLSGDEEENNSKKKKDDNQKAQVHYVAVKRPEIDPEKRPKEEEHLCGLVFVKRHHTAFILNKLIQEICNWEPELFFIKSSHITGHGFAGGGSRSRDREYQCRKQEEILRKFRNKELNLLIATQELEEGVDVPRCNLVMRFELPDNYRSYVQSKGRARARVANYYLLVEESRKEGFHKELQIYKGIERILMRKCESVEDDRTDRADVNDYILPPYKPNAQEDGPQVTMEMAITLVNRYCAKLPSDAFTHLTAKCTMSEVTGDEGSVMYQANLQLPINSPIKQPIQGVPMPSRKLAKMAVALKTCEILHKNGELDDSLQPVGKEVIKYEDEEGEWEEHEVSGQARPGTTKRKQYYKKKVADSLLSCPKSNSGCNMYVINMSLTSSITEEQNTRGRKIHAPEDTPRCFGILCQHQIPLVPQFPVFTRSGEVTVSVDLVCTDLHLTSEQLERLKKFHHVVFRRVLRLEKDPMLFSPANAHSSYLVSPLIADSGGNLSIDWAFISHVENAPLPAKRPELYATDRTPFVFDTALFQDAVVMPSYRNMDQPQYFYVAEIRHDLTPKSPFPSPEVYNTFEQYYSAKYGLKISNLEQPLLDVDHTSARLNLLTPRYMNQKGVALPTSSAETRRQRRENLQQKQILVPELCDVHPFPASLWRKAVCLPAILYRTNCLLIAEELRKTIAWGAQIGEVEVPEDFRFEQLEFGFSTKPGDGEPALVTELSTDKPKEDQSRNSARTPTNKPGNHLGTVTNIKVIDNKNDMPPKLSIIELPESPPDTSHEEKSPLTKKSESSAKLSNDHDAIPVKVFSKNATNNKDDSKQENESYIQNEPNRIDTESNMNGYMSSDRDSPATDNMEPSVDSDESEEHVDDKSVNDEVKKEEIVIVMDHIKAELPTDQPEEPSSGDQELGSLPDSHQWTIDLDGLGQDGMMAGLNHVMQFSTKTDDIKNFYDTGWCSVDDPTEKSRSHKLSAENTDTAQGEPSTSTELPNGDHSSNCLAPDTAEDDPASLSGRPSHPRCVSKQGISTTSCSSQCRPKATSAACGLQLSSSDNPAQQLSTSADQNARSHCDNNDPTECALSGSDHSAGNAQAVHLNDSQDTQTTSQTDSCLLCTCTVVGSCHMDGCTESSGSLSKCLEDSTFTSVVSQVTCRHSDVCDKCSLGACKLNESTAPSTSCNVNDCSAVSTSCNNNPACNNSPAVTVDSSVAPSTSCCENKNIVPSVISSMHHNTAPSTSCSEICDEDCPGGSTSHHSTVVPSFEHCENHNESDSDALAAYTAENCDCMSSLCERCEYRRHVAAAERQAAEEANQDFSPLVSFEQEVDLTSFRGPSPCLLLQALTMSNANDFFNLERLETIGDSFLKFAITVYLYCTYPGIHEGKLSYLRSKQVSNYNLYRLGKRKKLPERMVAAKFEPAENWLPPGFVIKKANAYMGLESLLPKDVPEPCSISGGSDSATAETAGTCSEGQPDGQSGTEELPKSGVTEADNHSEVAGDSLGSTAESSEEDPASQQVAQFNRELEAVIAADEDGDAKEDSGEEKLAALIPYKLQTQHSLPDKSIADCVEALIGCYLTTCGARAALQFMSWLGLKVLPDLEDSDTCEESDKHSSSQPHSAHQAPAEDHSPSPDNPSKPQSLYGTLKVPASPLLPHLPDTERSLPLHLDGYEEFEKRIHYKFKDRAYLLQAFTHASYHYNHSTDCYQRLEFLGDAILDYVITRHLFEDVKKHSPGILTDLRSALVNNNIFAALAVKWDFHKYFKAVSPQLFQVIDKFVTWQKDRNDEINLDEEFEDFDDDVEHDGEDIEIPKALGDIFESVAGAIYLDSGMSLDTVWKVYYRLMKPQIDTFTERIPKSPVRELLEMEPETAKFEKPERTLDGKIRVTVNVVDKGQFKGVGRNYRIAKSAAARRALKYIRMLQVMAEQQGGQPGYHYPFLDGVLGGQQAAGPRSGVPFIDWG